MKILIVESETPELLQHTGNSLAHSYGEELKTLDSDVQVAISEPYRNGFVIDDLAEIDAVVFPGAGVSWSADDPQGQPLAHAMEMVFERGLPCFGSCNGLQLAAVLLGGRIMTAAPEVGIARNVTLTDVGKVHPMMKGRRTVFSAPTVHADQVVELPDGAQHLAYNEHTQFQAFAYEANGVNFWGVEYHPELSIRSIGEYIDANRAKFDGYLQLVDDLLDAQSSEAAAARLGSAIDELARPARTLELQNWLSFVKG